MIPKSTEAYTGFYLLTEGEDGDLVASGYPAEVTRGRSQNLVVGINNHEGQRTTYTVIVELQRVTTASTQVQIEESQRVNQFQVTLNPNETRRIPHSVTPRMSGTNLRLQYKLYKGKELSERPNSNFVEKLHLWMNVTAPSD
jgi:uncharacterized membrane protein